MRTSPPSGAMLLRPAPMCWRTWRVRRAIDGSDTLLIFMLKARRPEKFKDRQSHEHSGPGGGPIEARAMDLKDLPTDVLHDLKELAARVSDGDPPPASD